MSSLKLIKLFVHAIFRTRHFGNKEIKKFARNINNQNILEIGSGKKNNNKFCYSAKRFFNNSNNFVCSDVTKSYGHKIVDITTMDFKNKFDIILCINVLEHVFNFEKAISNIFNALKQNGTALIFVPAFYPLHDEPFDYWRFTEHSLKILLNKFKIIEFKNSGIKQYPFAYFIQIQKV